MYEEAEPVRRGTSTLGSGRGQSSAPPSQAPPVNRGGPSGRDSHGDGGSEESPEGAEASADPYEEAERVYYTINPGDLSASLNGARLLTNQELESAQTGDDAEHTRRHVNLRYTMDTCADRSYPGKESGRRALFGFLVAGFAVLATLVTVGLTMIVLAQKEMSRLSNTVDALKRDLDQGQNRTASLEQRLHEMGKTYRMGIPDGPIGTVGSTVPTEIPFFPSPTGPPEPLERHQTSAQSLSTADYTEFRGICYKKSKIPKAFSEAAVACIEDGGNLAMPKDADSNAFLKTLHVLQGDYLWIGLHDRPEEGSFQWMDGTPLGEFTSWGPGQPDGTSGSEDCVTWAHVGGQSSWNDYECLHDFLFVCQVIPGWLFGSFMYDKDQPNPAHPGEDAWRRLVPMALQWGNDPDLTPDAYYSLGKRPKESWNNQRVKELKFLPKGRPFLGYLERANGIVDSFISCHSTASILPPKPVSKPAATPGMEPDTMQWFRNVGCGEPFEDGVLSLDYSMQLIFGMKGLKGWLKDNPEPSGIEKVLGCR